MLKATAAARRIRDRDELAEGCPFQESATNASFRLISPKTPASRERLVGLIAAAVISVRNLVRWKGTSYDVLGLDDPPKDPLVLSQLGNRNTLLKSETTDRAIASASLRTALEEYRLKRIGF